MVLESGVVLSVLNSQVARDYLTESLAGAHSIAPLPRVCAQLAQLTAQQATDAAQLSRLIQSDPSLAGEIMRVANSPALRPRAPIVSLQQAVSWLGVADVRNLAEELVIESPVFEQLGVFPDDRRLMLAKRDHVRSLAGI